MKGIILAGGSGTRLHPITKVVSKQLLPVYDKPMIYYPLSLLMLANINDILIISTPHDLPNFKKLFGNGSNLGLNISYKEQPSPDGIAQAFIIGEEFIANDDVCLVLGDNILINKDLTNLFSNVKNKLVKKKIASVFGYRVENPRNYGVIEFNKENKVLSIDEKPINPKSNFAVIGLYFYPNSVINVSKNIQKSDRGELEITSVNQYYLNQDKLNVELLDNDYKWFDTGNPDDLLIASNYISKIKKNRDVLIGSLKDIFINNNLK